MPEPESIVLRYLRSINTKMGGSARDIGDVRIQLSSLETGMTGVEAAVVHVQERLDGVQAQLDNATKRLDRIERRLDLTSTPTVRRQTVPCAVPMHPRGPRRSPHPSLAVGISLSLFAKVPIGALPRCGMGGAGGARGGIE